jgi:1-acyl-sn-glycerol-3-phosphate acyltransferase
MSDRHTGVAIFCIQQCLRAFADGILCTVIAFGLTRDNAWSPPKAALAVVALYLAPAALGLLPVISNIVLAPFVAILLNIFDNRRLQIVCAFGASLTTGLAAKAGASYAPMALFPIAVLATFDRAARDTRLFWVARTKQFPWSRLDGWLAALVFAGLAVALVFTAPLVDTPTVVGLSLPLMVAAGANGLALLAAWRSEPFGPLSGSGRGNVFMDARCIAQQSTALRALLASILVRGLALAFVAVLALGPQAGALNVVTMGLLILGGVAIGAFLAGVQGHPRRSLGLIPLAMTGLCIAMAVSIWLPMACLAIGVMAGVLHVALVSAYQSSLPEGTEATATTILETLGAISCFGAIALAALFRRLEWMTSTLQLLAIIVLTGMTTLVAWRYLLREVIEQVTEWVLWPIYRIRAVGPGVHSCPSNGPALIVANHSAYLDPLWLGKVVPRRLVPMMTSAFYDLPLMRWLMNRIVRAVRVPTASFRREAPELEEAVATLDRGDCLVIFPEAMLRRREDQPLRPFGQGVWHILRERPATPVIPCWIEGGWGSYFSYWSGPPTKNKRWDWWRHILVGMSEPAIIGPELLADQRATRRHLQDAVLHARTYTGKLPVQNPSESDARRAEPTQA